SLLTCAFYGWLLEELNIKMFGTYHYPDVYLLRVGEVPLFIPFGWAVIIHSSMAITNRMSLASFSRPFMDGLLAVLLDLAVDAVAIRLGLWHWTVPWEGNRQLRLDEGWFGVPPANLTSWMWVAASYSFFRRALGNRRLLCRRIVLRETLIVALSYCGLVAGIYFTGTVTHLVRAKSESEQIWVFAGQLACFLALCIAGRRPAIVQLRDGPGGAPFSFTLTRWGIHFGALGTMVVTGMWHQAPALWAVCFGTVGIECCLIFLQRQSTRASMEASCYAGGRIPKDLNDYGVAGMPVEAALLRNGTDAERHL
ncbi:MAG TPA: carotenoid biosynthesis protein, partial [Verrucomicrobiae bacterium]|nr:carotenoid biosynthesis protein [Verrucomicrobiae bacterium]